ncbi:hypothetical protein [Streptomyces longhuiensis]|uniref:hypothetical protein n=1 Tax=Streptomyces longhuiensis TaxID=2880933 RepID=UPI001D0B7761|nr:hypothetical protein [Streptomyces longhuiensis]UDM00058.1 hypothetical protein LGI35_18120 [Streptomyces longhuiensis]
MDHGTHPNQADEALRQATGNQITDEPATVEACQQDYADAADVRARLGWTDGSNA